MIRKFSAFLGNLCLRLLVCILAGTLLLSAVYCIPKGPIDRHVAASVPALAEEGPSPQLFSWCASQLDNFTDAIMLMSAAYDGEGSPLEQAMSVTRGRMEKHKDSPFQAMKAHYLDGESYDSTADYTRYWHGYLVYMKPLLAITTYQGIRILNACLQLVLLGALLVLLHRRGLKGQILPWLVSFSMIMPPTLMLSMQYSSCYYAMTLGTISLLVKKERSEKDLYTFFFIGVAVAYFDFLTYPMVTLAVPLCIWFCLRQHENIWDSLFAMVKGCFCWCFGYGGMWASKWVLAAAVLGGNPVSDALDKAAERTGVEGGSFLSGLVNAEYANIMTFLRTPVTILAMALGLVLLVLVLKNWRGNSLTLSRAALVLMPFVLIACMAPVWYAVLSNHSAIHAFFTHKALMGSVLAALSGLQLLNDKDRI